MNIHNYNYKITPALDAFNALPELFLATSIVALAALALDKKNWALIFTAGGSFGIYLGM